jgi:uncharacterized protein (DUF427 family)
MFAVSLTAGRGPLAEDPAGRTSPPLPPGGAVYVEPHPRRVVAEAGGRVVLDTERALLVHRPRQRLAFAFPPDVVGDLPNEPDPDAPGFVRVPWDAVDAWYEEGRRLVHYPPNPYHRVDCRPTTRALQVQVGGTTLVDTDDTLILFETSLAPKLYVAKALVRMDLLRPSATTTWCNYKGVASWWTAVIGDDVIDDVAWSYEDPLPESSQIAGMLSFDVERAHVVAELPAGSTLHR